MSIIELSQARSWLRFPNPNEPSSDDGLIYTIIGAVEQVLEFHAGVCSVKTYTENYDGGDCSIWLRHPPLVSVNEVRESWGIYTVTLDYQDAQTGPELFGVSGGANSAQAASSIYAYSIDDYEVGMITRRTIGNVALPFAPGVRSVQVTYRAGREVMTPALTLAAMELTAHIYQAALQRGVSMSGVNLQYDASVGQLWSRDDSDQGSMSAFVGVPYRVLQLIESEKVKLPAIA